MKNTILYAAITALCFSCGSGGEEVNPSKEKTSAVKVVGAMKNVMWKGELEGVVVLDTLQNKKGLYGVGPAADLKGELLILDGVSYLATVARDSSANVKTTYAVQAPFFVYANATEWHEEVLPDTIITLPQLEAYLERSAISESRPFVFKLKGSIEKSEFHIQNLPEGSRVSSPAEAHRGQVSYIIEDTEVAIVGFFSREHQGIFTHHDTYLHMHVITEDRTQMGHLDSASFEPGKMKLYLPKK